MEISNEKLIQMFRYMYLARRFDEVATQLNKEKRIIGSVHTGVGEEGASVGITMALSEGDYISPSYRDVGAILAGGLSTLEVMAMLYAKDCGHTQGRTRLMHLGDLPKRILPPNPILGASQAIAIGVAYANQRKKNGSVVVNIMGDGASNEGAVHESMNFAAVYNLPIVFCLVNNHYAWSTPTRDILKLDIVADRAKAYGFPGYVCNGNDVLETYETVYNAVERARSGQGPSLVEVRAYRWSGHSGNDKNVYRTQDEIIRWQQDDCVTKFEGYLTAVGVLSREEVKSIKDAVEEEIADAIRVSEASPYPDPEKLLDPYCMLYKEDQE